MSAWQAAVQDQQLSLLRQQAVQQTAALQQSLGGPAAPPQPPPLLVMLDRMGDGEDPLTFIETFQATVLACRWPEEEWAPRLLPLLPGEAQMAALSLPPASPSVFVNVCRAVLDRLGLTPEDHQRRFQASWMSAGEQPFTWARQLEEAAARWLRPGPTEEETCLLNLVVSLVKTAGLCDGF